MRTHKKPVFAVATVATVSLAVAGVAVAVMLLTTRADPGVTYSIHTLPAGPDATVIAVDYRADQVLVVDASSRSGDSTVRFIDVESERARRTLTFHDHIYALELDAAARRAFIIGDDSLSMVDVDKGTILRTTRLPLLRVGDIDGDARAAVDSNHHHLFVATKVGLVMLSTRSGRLLATFHVPGGAAAVAADARADHVVITTYLPRSGDEPATDTMGVATIDIRTGRRLAIVCRGLQRSHPVVDAVLGKAFIGAVDLGGESGLCVVDTHTGALKELMPFGGSGGIPSATVIEPRMQRIFVTSTDIEQDPAGNYLYAVDPRDDGLLFVRLAAPDVDAHGTGFLAVDGRQALVAAISSGLPPRGPGSLSLIDETTYRITHTFPLGYAVRQVAIDEQHHRIFVLEGETKRAGRWSREGVLRVLTSHS